MSLHGAPSSAAAVPQLGGKAGPPYADVLERLGEYDLASIGYQYGNPWALSPNACRLLGLWIRTRRPRMVVEFGAGASTYVIAAEIAAIPGAQFASFEDRLDVYNQVQGALVARGLGTVGRVYRCDIGLGWYGGRPLFFYRIPDSLWRRLPPVELALIDGPPEYNYGREAAGYKLLPKMAPGGWIMLDDAHRPHERQCVENWRYYANGGLDGWHLDLEEPGKSIALLCLSARKRYRWSATRAAASLRESRRRWVEIASQDRPQALALLWPGGGSDTSLRDTAR